MGSYRVSRVEHFHARWLRPEISRGGIKAIRCNPIVRDRRRRKSFVEVDRIPQLLRSFGDVPDAAYSPKACNSSYNQAKEMMRRKIDSLAKLEETHRGTVCEQLTEMMAQVIKGKRVACVYFKRYSLAVVGESALSHFVGRGCVVNSRRMSGQGNRCRPM